jgi:hypothetical protein
LACDGQRNQYGGSNFGFCILFHIVLPAPASAYDSLTTLRQTSRLVQWHACDF